MEFKWGKCSDPDGDSVTYNLHVCEDADLSQGCIANESIATVKNHNPYYLFANISLLCFGVIFLLGARTRNNVLLILFVFLISSAILISCGSNSTEEDNGDNNSLPKKNEITQVVSGLKEGTIYYWNVSADDGNEGKTESEVRSFTTQ